MTLIKAWTTQKLAQLGLWLASAFGLGIATAQTTATRDTWTPDALTNFGLAMSKGLV